tara:strand:+ start:206 stop:424 length:219 start_codon:yes stop_codon:yes gene_type:complete
MGEENDLFLKQMKGVTQIKKKSKFTNTKIIKQSKWEKNKIKPNTNSGTEKKNNTNFKKLPFFLRKNQHKKKY